MNIHNSRFFKYKYWIDWFAPNRCPVCRKAIMWNELICSQCLKELPFLDKCKIDKCEDYTSFVCSLFEYRGVSRKAIMNLKERDGVNLAEFSANKLCDFLCKNKISDKIDLITAVPMRFLEKGDRGYNQAEVIAEYVAKRLNKPVDNRLLKCRRKKLAQHNLNKQERFINAQKSYKINKHHCDINGKNILICDDVITTGATISACAKKLKDIGAEKIFALSICSTDYFNSKE